MAHFAKLDQNNIVIGVHSVNNSVIIDETGQESEALGIQFLSELHNYSDWKQTSYNNKIRKNYAGIGYFYDSVRDAFIPPKPFNSWVLNENTCLWEAPVPYPSDNKMYVWDEQTISWIEVTE